MGTDAKIIIATLASTAVIITGAIFFLLREAGSSVPADQIVAQGGIHWHPRLSIFIKGVKQELSDGIGLGAVHEPMHTHPEDYKEGVIHMEIPGTVTKDKTKLANFFNIWGKQFSPTQLFDQTTGTGGTIRMLVNGLESSEFQNYPMRDADRIEIRYN